MICPLLLPSQRGICIFQILYDFAHLISCDAILLQNKVYFCESNHTA